MKKVTLLLVSIFLLPGCIDNPEAPSEGDSVTDVSEHVDFASFSLDAQHSARIDIHSNQEITAKITIQYEETETVDFAAYLLTGREADQPAVLLLDDFSNPILQVAPNEIGLQIHTPLDVPGGNESSTFSFETSNDSPNPALLATLADSPIEIKIQLNSLASISITISNSAGIFLEPSDLNQPGFTSRLPALNQANGVWMIQPSSNWAGFSTTVMNDGSRELCHGDLGELCDSWSPTDKPVRACWGTTLPPGQYQPSLDLTSTSGTQVYYMALPMLQIPVNDSPSISCQ